MFFSPKIGHRNLHEMMNDNNTPKIPFSDFHTAFNAREVLGRSSSESVTGRVLLGIQGVSKVTILKIMEKYPTMRELYDALNSETEKKEFIAHMGSDKKIKNAHIVNTFTKNY